MNRAARPVVVAGVTMTSVRSPQRSATRADPLLLALRVIAAALLAVSAYVHIHKAPAYNFGSTLTGEEMFYGQGVVAALVALWLLVRGSRIAWLAAAVVGAASFSAVMLYRYVDVGAIGPIPNMYDPIWFTEKTLSAIAEAGVVVVWAVQETTRFLRR